MRALVPLQNAARTSPAGMSTAWIDVSNRRDDGGLAEEEPAGFDPRGGGPEGLRTTV